MSDGSSSPQLEPRARDGEILALGFDSVPCPGDSFDGSLTRTIPLRATTAEDVDSGDAELSGPWGVEPQRGLVSDRQARPARRRKGSSEAVVAGLAFGRPYPEIAAAAGVSVRTVQSRAADPTTRTAVVEMKIRVLDQAQGQIVNLVPDAVAQLSELVMTGKDSTRLRAIMFVLDRITEYVQLADLDRRVGAVEDRGQDPEEL